MKKTCALIMLFVGLGAAPALAAPYVSVSAGLGLPGDFEELSNAWGVNSGVSWNGAVGYDFNGPRVEAAIGYQETDFASAGSGQTSFYSFMANACYDIPIVKGAKAYVLGGVGVMDLKADDDPPTSYWLNETYFAWQLGAGVGIDLSKSVVLDLGYRYLKPENIICAYHDADVNWENHSVMAGIRYSF
ncbi:MAG: porin family protein [Chlorobiaceae bacterium]|nr:porin family protein [Chlorobiaceae bacterium]